MPRTASTYIKLETDLLRSLHKSGLVGRGSLIGESVHSTRRFFCTCEDDKK
jgi:hypothetical protein